MVAGVRLEAKGSSLVLASFDYEVSAHCGVAADVEEDGARRQAIQASGCGRRDRLDDRHGDQLAGQRGRGVRHDLCEGAGLQDLPVAEEAAPTAEVLGNVVVRLYDVGVAGIHRLLAHADDIARASVVVAVAGMEGALPSVVGGLASCPVIAVPTSVGYGVSFGGVAALLAMLNSCASGVSVVNIDNGFGAGYQAHMINHVKARTA